MSEKKFMSYGDAETIFTGYANEIKSKVDWESNSVLGAKNLLHIDNIPTNVASSADDENGISIITTSTGAWGYLGQFNAKANVRYTINATVCGYGRFAFSTSKSTFPDNSLPTYAELSSSSNKQLIRSGQLSTTFMLSADTSLYLWFCTIPIGGTPTGGDAFDTKVMVRLASDTDTTYQPYAMTNRELTDSKFDRSEQAVLGAKNLLENTAPTQTINDVTFTPNADGSVTVNGTASADTYYRPSNQVFSVGTYIWNGCPSGGSDSSYWTFCRTNDTTSAEFGKEYGNSTGVSFTLTTDKNINYYISVRSGYTANNLIFYPMIRLATDTDDTYVPYAMTNKQLTDEVAGKQNTLTFDTTPTNASTNPVTSGGIYTALGTKANESMIGDAWTASTTYGVAGNTNGYPVYCINDNVLYKCIQEHTGAAYEPPNATYWEATDVNTEITALNNSLTANIYEYHTTDNKTLDSMASLEMFSNVPTGRYLLIAFTNRTPSEGALYLTINGSENYSDTNSFLNNDNCLRIGRLNFVYDSGFMVRIINLTSATNTIALKNGSLSQCTSLSLKVQMVKL